MVLTFKSLEEQKFSKKSIKKHLPEKKGDNGILLHITGSCMYSGAAYFSAKSSIMMGADLIYLFTSDLSNITALKSLLPEVIIIDLNKIKRLQDIEWILKRIDCILIGPGLSRVLNKTINLIVNYFINKRVEMIFDGDGILLFKDFFTDKKLNFTIFLTPNKNELPNAKLFETSLIKNCNSVILIEKGEIDKIYLNTEKKVEVNLFGSKRRCGGQGDILAGILCAILKNRQLKNLKNKISKEHTQLDLAKLSCIFMRFFAKKAYEKKKFSLKPSDILRSINFKNVKKLKIKITAMNNKKYVSLLNSFLNK